MLRKSISVIIFITFISVSMLMAQASILNRSDELIKKGKIEEAYKLLQRSARTYAKNADFQWKIAKVAYWDGDISASKDYYNAAIKLSPTNLNIKLDYAKVLYEIGDYKEASVFFSQYLAYDNTVEDIWAQYIKSSLYDGKAKDAERLIATAPANIQSALQMTALKKEILEFRALNIGVSAAYTSDDQPMYTITPKFRIAKRESHYLNWSVEGAFNSFTNDTLSSSSQTIKVGNTVHFRKLGLDAQLSFGATLLNSGSKSSIIGGILLTKSITKAFALESEFSRNPYYYSIPSTQTLVTQDNIGGAIVINDLAKFTGRLQIQTQTYNDKNKVQSTSGWVLSPSLTGKKFQTKIGYSFEDTNADRDNFKSVKSLNQIIQNYATTKEIVGVFDPYFTPRHQKSQNALLWLLIQATDDIAINFTGNYALSATFDNPVLYLDKDNLNQTYIQKDFIKQNYKPTNYRAGVTYTPNKKLITGLNYEYFKSAYYTANTFMLSLNYRLVNEK